VRGLATDKSGVAWVKVNRSEALIEETGNFLKDIPVSAGANTIVVEAADRLGNRTTLSVTVERKASKVPASGAASVSDFYGKSIAVVIGINGYEKWPPLEYAVQDAKAIQRRIQEIGFDNVTLILDKEATQSRILTELFHNLPQKVGPDDRLVFYFAGHGQTVDISGGAKQGYIIPVDGEPGQESGTAISMEQVKSLSSRISAKHILYVMDSCYSGLGLSRSAGPSPTLSGFLRKVASMRAVQIVTAGGSGEQAQERGGHGLFTGFFLKALEGDADINKDGVVTRIGAGHLSEADRFRSLQPGSDTSLREARRGGGVPLLYRKKVRSLPVTATHSTARPYKTEDSFIHLCDGTTPGRAPTSG